MGADDIGRRGKPERACIKAVEAVFSVYDAVMFALFVRLAADADGGVVRGFRHQGVLLLCGQFLHADGIQFVFLENGENAGDACLPVVGGFVAACADVEGADSDGVRVLWNSLVEMRAFGRFFFFRSGFRRFGSFRWFGDFRRFGSFRWFGYGFLRFRGGFRSFRSGFLPMQGKGEQKNENRQFTHDDDSFLCLWKWVLLMLNRRSGRFSRCSPDSS